jgi:hypothetical protein
MKMAATYGTKPSWIVAASSACPPSFISTRLSKW